MKNETEPMTEQHPITPPPELVQQWYDASRGPRFEHELATQAARWGADTELGACCAYIHMLHGQQQVDWLRSKRRPKPSLRDRALHILGSHGDLSPKEHDTIRKALEQLND